MIINLQEIPPEGKTFVCNRNTADLNEALEDLIGSLDYSAEFSIRPLSNGTYDLIGKIQTDLDEDCSRCGIDFRLHIDENFHELLIPQQPQDRTSHYSKANHFSELHSDGLNVVEYQGHHFLAGEYLHEVVALAEPLNPRPEMDSSGKCTLCHKTANELFHYEDRGFEGPQKNPFDALKKMKFDQ